MREPAHENLSGQYERPNQPWVCGLASQGHACPAGPAAGGHCPALAECAPMRDSDRWRCNRSALRGGVCDAGPTLDGACPRVSLCRPVRSLRSKRARFVLACTAFAVGTVVIGLSTDLRNRVLAPGPLATSHAQLLGRDDAGPNCAACHAASERGVASWAASLVAGHGSGPSQSQLCMKCHGTAISPELATMPHNLPPGVLQRITATRAASSRPALAQFVNTAVSPGDRLACSACHREHHGPQFDLTAINNKACQTCHHDRYESFAEGHPDFGRWPYERPTRIVFNHASHRSKYFKERKQAFDCQSCHVADSTQTVQLTATYEATCAACHDERVVTSVAQGIPMFVVPTLDVEELRAAGHDIGDWPEAANGDFDGRLPPPMKLLLSADPAAAQAMHTLGEDFEFFDVDPDDPQQLAACAALAKAIQQLFADLGNEGNASLRERLAMVLGRKMADSEVDALAAGLSEDTVQGVSAWMLTVSQSGNEEQGSEFRIQDQATAGAATPEHRTLYPEPSYAPAGTWFVDDATLTIRYRPAAHADPVLTGWLQLLASVPDLVQKPVAMAVFEELTDPMAAGLCASCHRVEQSAAGQRTVNWQAFDRASGPRSFTKFSHGPHLVLPQLADCTACHAITPRPEPVKDRVRGFETATNGDGNGHPGLLASEFLPLSKQTCIQCHIATAAGDDCQQCHSYHVDLELPTKLGPRARDVVGIFKPAVHHVEPQ